MARRFQSFAEFWPFYLGEHRKPGTRAVHVVGTFLLLACLVAAAVTFDWRWLVAAPIAVYGIAWPAHFFIEKNRPATFQHPFYSMAGDFKMVFVTLTGRISGELQRLPPAP